MSRQEKIWMLSFDEFRVLLSGLGFTSCQGIYMPEKEFSEKEVLYSLYRMQNDTCIEPCDDGFRISEDLRMILQAVGNPEKTEILRQKTTGREFFCYFRGSTAAVTERYWLRDCMIRLYGFDTAAFEEWRRENFDDCDSCECAGSGQIL